MGLPRLNRGCYACGADANYAISLAITGKRLYLPNQLVREKGDLPGPKPEEVGFCSTCMRKIEDNLRATVLYLQSESS